MIKVSKRLENAFDGETPTFQKNVCDTVHAEAEYIEKLFLAALCAIDKSLELMVGRTAQTDESALPETSSSRTAGWSAQVNAPSRRVSFSGVPLKWAFTDLMPSSPSAFDPRDHLKRGT